MTGLIGVVVMLKPCEGGISLKELVLALPLRTVL